MRQRLQVDFDWTVRARSAHLKAAGITVSHSLFGGSYALRKTFEKTPVESEQDRPKVDRHPDAVEAL